MRTSLGIAVVFAAVALCGCGHRAASPAPKAKPAQPVRVSLPNGAPKNPSPEFLRAAKVLKPIPPEMLLGAGETLQIPKAVLERYTQWWPAGYEFFGTFSDEQIERVRKTGFLRVHVRDLTPKQRAAFEAFMDAKDRALAGTGNLEYRVSLYKFGAKKDLSNVDVGFDMDARAVLIRTWVPNAGAPSKTITTGDGFATM